MLATLLPGQFIQVVLNSVGFLGTPPPVRVVYHVLPEAATNTLSYFYGQVDYGGPPATFAGVAPALALAVPVAYLAVCVSLAVGLTRRRDIA